MVTIFPDRIWPGPAAVCRWCVDTRHATPQTTNCKYLHSVPHLAQSWEFVAIIAETSTSQLLVNVLKGHNITFLTLNAKMKEILTKTLLTITSRRWAGKVKLT